MKLPGSICAAAASFFFVSSHTASDQDSIGAAGVAPSLIGNARYAELARRSIDGLRCLHPYV
eukprot:1136276-Pelagomonas_calceolata.AAC.3